MNTKNESLKNILLTIILELADSEEEIINSLKAVISNAIFSLETKLCNSVIDKIDSTNRMINDSNAWAEGRTFYNHSSNYLDIDNLEDQRLVANEHDSNMKTHQTKLDRILNEGSSTASALFQLIKLSYLLDGETLPSFKTQEDAALFVRNWSDFIGPEYREESNTERYETILMYMIKTGIN